MSKYFVEGEAETIKDIFNKKQMYKIVSRSDKPNLIDFNHGEKRLYGRVDRYYQPIVPNEKFLSLRELNPGAPRSIKAFNFVVDAFKEMQNKFNLKRMMGEIDINDQFLATLKPVNAYQDPYIAYSKFMRAYSHAVKRVINDNNLVFTNFDEFINVIMPYIENSIKKRTFTYPAYVKSKDCPINVSGLVIEIAEIDPNNDKFKYDKFYQSKNWEFFLNACNAYGFMVDCNMPNRIIADVNSANMISKMRKYSSSINSADKLISNCYSPVSQISYGLFKKFLYDLYSDNRKPTVLTTTNNYNDGTRSVIRKVQKYTFLDFEADVGYEKLITLYFKIRFLEEESQFTDYEKKVIMSDIVDISINDNDYGIQLFERLLNKTFDYSGSLSYIRSREKQLRQ